MRILKSPEFMFFVVAVFLRLVPHPPNMSPMVGYTLAGAAALRFPLLGLSLSLIVTDIFLGFHDVMAFVYGGYFLIFAAARLGGISANAPLAKWLGFGAIGSVLFFVVSNFGVWLQSTVYPKSFLGLVMCYEAGLPFLTNSLIADLGTTFFAWTALKFLTSKFNQAPLKVEIS